MSMVSTTILRDIEVAKDTDTTSYIGRTAIGFNGTTTDFATLAHLDRNNQYDYGFGQDTLGATFLNASNGQYIDLLINNVSQVRLHTSGNVGIGTITPLFTLDVAGSTNVGSFGATNIYSKR